MTSEKPQPIMTPKAAKAEAERQRRRAEALRENLRKRKAQARVRAEDDTSPPDSSTGDRGDGAGQG